MPIDICVVYKPNRVNGKFEICFVYKQDRVNMKFEREVFKAVADGKLYRLKVLLEQISRKKRAQIINDDLYGSTVLTVACLCGHLEVASYLVEKCNADVEKVGLMKINGDSRERASPLHCAAYAGHFVLVRYLLKQKVSVNSTTRSNSTPLSAACYMGHFEIVKCLVEHGADIEIATKRGFTCLMRACRKGHVEIVEYLIEQGADVNRKRNNGSTALQDCAEVGNLRLLKLLLRNKATFVSDSSGTTPLLSAALGGHICIVEYFIEEFACSKQDKIDALELLGATFADSLSNPVFAFSSWNRAMKLRHQDRDCPIEKPETAPPIAGYVNATEFRTLSELKELKLRPFEMSRQSLLVRERILGPNHLDNLFYIRKRGIAHRIRGNIGKCVKLWTYVMNAMPKDQEPLSKITQERLSDFTQLFLNMMNQGSLFGSPYVSFCDIFNVFKRAVDDIETARELSLRLHQTLNVSEFHHFLTLSLHLVGMMCQFQPQVSKNEELNFKEAVYRLVHLNPKGDKGSTLLHIACYKSCPLSRHPVFVFPSSAAVDLLLEVGASPHALNYDLDTPLHIAASNRPFDRAMFDSLLKHGAHLDQCNIEKRTPLQLALQRVPSLDINPLQYINLQCLSAKVIRSHRIPYKGFLHEEIEVFLDTH